MCDTSNFTKSLDKFSRKVYNGIVNSKGAADHGSVALFLVYSANSIHKGVYEVSGLLHPFDILCCYFRRRFYYGFSDYLTTGT